MVIIRFFLFYSLADLFEIGPRKWKLTANHGVENDPAAKHVKLEILGLVVEHFGWDVVGRAHEPTDAAPDFGAEPQVHYFQVINRAQAHLLWLERDEHIL